jgi:hypothetical protein
VIHKSTSKVLLGVMLSHVNGVKGVQRPGKSNKTDTVVVSSGLRVSDRVMIDQKDEYLLPNYNGGGELRQLVAPSCQFEYVSSPQPKIWFNHDFVANPMRVKHLKA